MIPLQLKNDTHVTFDLEKMTLNAIIYARFSPRPLADDCDSHEKQIQRCRAYCEAKGWTVIAEPYVDEALSGGSDDRPAFQEAIARACRDKLAFVVYDLSRFSRSTEDAVKYVNRLNDSGAQFVSITESFDTTTPMGEFVFTVFAALATMQRKNISRRTSAAMLYHQANGRRMSNRTPYGWRVDPANPKRIIEHDGEQAVLSRMVQLRQEGVSLREIAAKLNAGGMPGRSGPWAHQTIQGILARAGAA